jgi:hypothetical protein
MSVELTFYPSIKGGWKGIVLMIYLPLQVTPSPSKPWTHAHWNDPYVFLHVALIEQL